MSSEPGVENPLLHPLAFLYQLVQWLISLALAPNPPKDNPAPNRPRIAIIGAGLTGVTAAAHCAGHGFDVQIFEQADEEAVGGIWTVSRSALSDTPMTILEPIELTKFHKAC